MRRCFTLFLMLILTAACICACKIKPPSEKTVESIVDKSIPEDSHCISVRDDGEHVYYTFESDLRDLRFEVVAFENQTGFGGYWERIYYSDAVREHYKKDIYSELRSCPFCKGRNEEAENAAFIFRINSDEDIREVAKAIARCNKVVSDQFKYTPDADLTSSKIMNYRMHILRADESMDDGYIYVLNGKDDEDAVYKVIRR